MSIEIEQMDKSWVISLLAEGYDTYYIVTNKNMSEELILECHDLLDKEVIMCINLSEKFVNDAIEIGFFCEENIKELTMTTYSKFSEKFIEKYAEYINWQRMILYVSTQSDSFDKYIDIIEKNNLWSIISANDLDSNFVREWKDKLDWNYLSMVKCFTDEEKEEFVDYIKIPESKEVEGDFLDKSQFDFVKKMSDEELENLIEEINKHLYKK